jgi:hypothetical protein
VFRRLETASRGLDLAVALDVDLVGAVDHDLGHLDVVEELLHRAVAEDVLGQLLDELAPFFVRERELGLTEKLLETLDDDFLELFRTEGGVEDPGAEIGEQYVLHTGANGGERIGDVDEILAEGRCRCRPRGRKAGCRRGRCFGETVFQTHRRFLHDQPVSLDPEISPSWAANLLNDLATLPRWSVTTGSPMLSADGIARVDGILRLASMPIVCWMSEADSPTRASARLSTR